MANCSFITATEARNNARNDTLIWTEICEVQTQILAAMDGNVYSVIVNDNTPFTETQGILSTLITAGGTGYSLVSATAVINANGTGGTSAAVTPIVTGTTVTGFTVDAGGSGYVPVNVTASVQTNYNLNDAQTQVNYDGAGGNGTYLTGGTGVNANFEYAVGEVITLSENSTVAVGSITPAGTARFVLVAADTELNYVGGGGNGTLDSGGSGYAISDTITLNDGSVVTVDNVAAGVVTEFTVTTSSTNSNVSLTPRNQLSTSGSGTSFQIIPGTNNETAVGAVLNFTVTSGGADPFTLGSQVTQVSSAKAGGAAVGTVAIGLGFALVPTTNNAALIAHAGVAAVLTPIETSGAITSVVISTPGTAYVVGQPIIFSHPTGVGATASIATVSGTGAITGIIITNGGSGYASAVATVTVTAPGGLTPAVAFVGTVAVTAGVVTGIIITEGGTGYADLLPTVSITDATGTGATFTTNIAGGAVTAINIITAGSGYTAPTLTIIAAPTSGGVNATATATAGTNTFGTTPVDLFNAWSGVTTDAVLSDQIQFVLDYFTSLGYNIRVQTNSSTANTIQWQIIW